MSFGIVIEKFGPGAHDLELRRRCAERNWTGSPASSVRTSIALIAGGLALIAIQTLRFARNGRLLDDVEPHAASAVRTGSVLSVLLILLVTAVAIYSVFD